MKTRGGGGLGLTHIVLDHPNEFLKKISVSTRATARTSHIGDVRLHTLHIFLGLASGSGLTQGGQ